MLNPTDICVILTTSVRKLVEIAAERAGYGLGSGQAYAPGSNRLAPQDREAGVMVYWNRFLVRVQTPFLGRVSTAEHVYGLEAAVEFAVEHPALLYRHLLQGAERLVLETFSQGVADRTRQIAGRLACRYSPDALVGGPAMEQGQQEMTRELKRIYAPEGLSVSNVVLTDVSALIRGRELEMLVLKIEADAQQQRLAIEDAFRQNRRAIQDAGRGGDPQAKTLATQLAEVGSFRDLEHQVVRQQPQVAVADRAPTVSLAAEPVLMAGRHDSHARFAVLSPAQPPRYFEACREWFFVGRDPNCHISLPSNRISSHHATVARIMSGLAVVDHDSTHGTYYNGERIAQRAIENGDLLRIGDCWLVFKLEPGQEFQQIDHSLRGVIASSGGTIPAVTDAAGLVAGTTPTGECDALVELTSSAGWSVPSVSRPILIGSDSACDLRLADGGVARFHAVIYWDAPTAANDDSGEPGVFLADLHSGRGVLLNDRPTQRARLNGGDTLQIGGHRITVSTFGDVVQRAAALHAARPAVGNLAVTCIEGPAAGASIRLDPQTSPIVLGRNDDCDLPLRCPKISGRHAEIAVQFAPQRDGSYRPQFTITDLGSTNGTLVSGRRLQPHQPQKIRVGDIIRLVNDGDHCDLLVHETA
jgi:pSer/pThr/pTyr-binding forkhead associated (FHA) protein